MQSLAGRVGQLLMVGFEGSRPPGHILDWLAAGRIGGVYLFARNIESPAQVKQLVDDCRAAAKYPILVGIDQEGGLVARLRDGFSESPGAMALGAARDSQLAEDVAYMLGRELAALGINWNFAPVADIAHQRDNPSVSTRSVGSRPQLVSDIVTAQIRGFQRAGVAATVKHFPGLGNTIIDTHAALARVSGSLDYLYQSDLLPFRAALRADVACVMLTHVMYEALDSQFPATLSPRIVTDLLRGELGYTGAVCTDCMEMKAVTNGFGAGESAVLTVLAGVDLPLFSHTIERQEAAYAALLAAAQSGRISSARLDESLARIAALKRKYALDQRPPLEVVASAEHEALAQKAARAGMTLLKQGAAIPVRDGAGCLSIEFSAQRVSVAVEGRQPGYFSRYLAQRLPNIDSYSLDPAASRPEQRDSLVRAIDAADTLILLTRNAHLQAAQLALAQDFIDAARQVILICARNPYDAAALTDADTALCCNGESQPALTAAVDAICGDYQPNGQLTVDLA